MRRVVLSFVALAVLAIANAGVAAERTDTLPRPRKSEPVRQDNARCAALGAGFVAVPGSQTCVKVGGYVRMEMQRSLGDR